MAEADEYLHPAFPQPVDRSTLIWRYMEMDKFVSLVESASLYMTRADLFISDEFEGTTPQAELDAWRAAAMNAATEEERSTIENNREQLSAFAREFREKYYVSCWTMAPDENVAMWERFTKTPSSVAVSTRYSALQEQFDQKVVNVGVVRYIDFDAHRLPSTNVLELITHKRHFFSDEREVRAVMFALTPEPIRVVSVDPYMTSDGLGFCPPVNILTLIEGVVLHPKASPEFQQEVAKLCATHGLPSPSPSRMAQKPVH